MGFLSIATTIFGTIAVFGILPQIIKVYMRKSAKDISLITYLIFIIANILWFFYGLELKSFPLTFTSAIAIIFQFILIIEWFFYGK